MIQWGTHYAEGAAASNGTWHYLPTSYSTIHYKITATNRTGGTFWTGHTITLSDSRQIGRFHIGCYDASVLYLEWISIGY